MCLVRKILGIVFFLTLFSCSWDDQEYILINDNPGKSPFITHSFTYFKGYFYEGSDKEFHYFVEKWNFLQNTYFKISTDDLFLTEAFMYGDVQIRVNISPTENSREFGETNAYKLYAVE